MERKGKTDLHKYSTFQKLTIISVATKIITTLTHYVSNLQKPFGKYLSTEINVEISQKSMQNN